MWFSGVLKSPTMFDCFIESLCFGVLGSRVVKCSSVLRKPHDMILRDSVGGGS